LISTVTTTTTTVTTATGTTISAGLGLFATIALIFSLIAAELAGAQAQNMSGTGEMTLSSAFARVLNIPIISLLIVFAFIVVVKIMEVLR